jgi:hypothetical protein
MNSVESQMEQALTSAGFTVSDTPPASLMSDAGEQFTEPAPAPAEAAPQAQESTQPAGAPEPQAQGQPESEPSSLTEPSNGGQFMPFPDDIFGETPTDDEFSGMGDDEFSDLYAQLDPRIQVIADFVAKTGRSPEDWFRYQALDPSEMDDLTAVRINIASEYPNLSNEEVNLLLSSKYKLDDSVYSEDDIRLGSLQLKLDATKARTQMETLREQFQMPEFEEQQTFDSFENPFDESWMRGMHQSLGELGQISFDLPNGKEFNYGIPESYRNELFQENVQMDKFFDKYMDDQGNWDHDLWNMHRTVTDNLPNILQSIYQQGLSDGQRAIVERAANVDASTPVAPVQNQKNALAEQILDALGRQQTLTFKI